MNLLRQTLKAACLFVLAPAILAQGLYLPHFELEGIDNRLYSLDDFRGQVTMVNFFFPT